MNVPPGDLSSDSPSSGFPVPLEEAGGAPRRILLGLSGASGVVYGLRTLEALLQVPALEVHVVVTKAAALVLKCELDIEVNPDCCDPAALKVPGAERAIFHHHADLAAPPASGSFPLSAVAVVPCSMGFVGAAAGGLARDLLERAADVALKERRPLVLVPRETPFSAVHLKNMLELSRAGAVVLPACPGFYGRPQSVSDLTDFVVARVLDHLRVSHNLGSRWGLGAR